MAVIVTLPTALLAQQPDAATLQFALNRGLRGSAASAIAVNVSSGRVVASYHLPAASAQEPGSTLKPLVAAIALRAGAVTPHTSVECRGNLLIGSHNLRCTHPRTDTIFNLEQAIAYSCNSWFAQLAEHMPTDQLEDGLRSYGLAPATTTASTSQRQLLALGLEGIRVTPLQLAEAYRILAQQFEGSQFSPVQNGMLDSVNYGMAHNAAVNGVLIAGKTGTAPGVGSSSTHGLFVGIIYSAPNHPLAVLVITSPRGNGGDAAALARRCMLVWSGQK